MNKSDVSLPSFDAFIAIDWSGASKSYVGIAVAKCEAGTSAPALVDSEKANHWTREAIADWLKRELNSGRRLLIGFDFAFGLPYEKEHSYLGGQAERIDSIFDLWDLIDRESHSDPDFGCGAFVDDPKYAQLFWKSGARRPTWIERKRRTELACAKVTNTYPETVYKLLGSKQVGKASLTGIRVLNHLRSAHGKQVAIWPFENVQKSAMVEIYPTLFRKAATGSLAKLRSLSDLNTALTALNCRPVRRISRAAPTDHETDALLSAAGLRRLARLPATWSLRNSSAGIARREGWIFGVSDIFSENPSTSTTATI